MSGARELLRAGPRVINIGVADFAAELARQGHPAAQLHWQPTVPPEAALAAARLTSGLQGSDLAGRIAAANQEALARITAAQPILVDVRRACEVVPGMTDRSIFHAGPPIPFQRMAGPMRGAVIGAILYEGLAQTESDAVRLAESGEIQFDPCHDHQAVGPMAGVLSPSMPVLVVENRAYGTVAYASMNEGWGRTLRFGAYDQAVIDRLRWMEQVLGPVLAAAVQSLGGVNVKALTAQALHMGDECHNRDIAATNLFFKLVAPAIAALERPAGEILSVLRFLSQHEHFFLNLSMAACKASLLPLHGLTNSTVLSVIARNGVDVGIKVAGLGERWFTAPAPIPAGLFFPGFSAADANPDMGDSAISETCGIGAFCMGAAPAIVLFVGGTPAEAMEYTQRMYEITVGRNHHFTLPPLDFAGAPTGVDVLKVLETGITPVINTGIAHKEPGNGLVGAGVSWAPIGCFTAAMEAIATEFAAAEGEVAE